MSSHSLSAPPSRQPLHLLPSPLPDPPIEDPTDDDYDRVPPTEPPSPLAPPNFQPLFTLLSNTGTSTTHHPNIHYVFSDDAPDSDPITAAALQILNPSSTATSSPGASPRDGKTGKGRSVKERYVLLDMDATGAKVESAQSLSPDWAVTSTELGPAPTWDRDGEGKQEGQDGRALMLRIEGVEVKSAEEQGGEVATQGQETRLEELVEVYERQMAELRRVVDAGLGVGRVNVF